MKRLALLLVAVVGMGCTNSAPAPTSIHVASVKAQSDFSVDFGEPEIVVTVASEDGCYEPPADESLYGTFRGVEMPIVRRGGEVGGDCVPTTLAIKFEDVDAPDLDDIVEIHDATTTITAEFAPSVLDLRTATGDWTLTAGESAVFTWSHVMMDQPRLSFCIPTSAGGQLARVWNAKPTGLVTGYEVRFPIPAQLEFAGGGEAMIEEGRGSGNATSCTGTKCSYAIDYFTIHSATAN